MTYVARATLCRYTPLQDWIQWDSNLSVADYCAKMQGNQWGGGIEMAAVAQLKKCHVLVYEEVGAYSGKFKRIGSFGAASAKAVRCTDSKRGRVGVGIRPIECIDRRPTPRAAGARRLPGRRPL